MDRFFRIVEFFQSLLASLPRALSSSLGIFCMLLILNGCSENPSGQPVAKEKNSAQPFPVKTATVVRKDVPVELRSVGLAEAFLSVAIKSQISGVLQEVGFKEGDQVKAGDLLFQIDSRPYLSRLEQVRATLAKDQAALENARKQALRYIPAAKKGYVSAEQSDQAQTNVATLRAQILADQAAVSSARIDLDNCTILAPISGYTGELFEDIGNLVKAEADQPLVTINQTSPIKVSFTLPEKNLPDLKRYLTRGDLEVIVNSAELTLTGKLDFLDNQVNQESGTIRLKATFDNQSRQLWPGQFVDVRLRLTTRRDATVVPTRAVQAGQNGDYVYVVNGSQTIEQRPVTVAFSSDAEAVVDSGLEVGETVVTDGQLRLRVGVTVKPVAEQSSQAAPGAAL
jgi:multidrug efflux system membrane fusion protein